LPPPRLSATQVTNPNCFTDVHGELFFVANGSQLRRSDATDAGTTPVEDINPGTGSGVTIGGRVAGAGVNETHFFAASSDSTTEPVLL
jgi:ELWxxDGT repeat protein